MIESFGHALTKSRLRYTRGAFL